MLRNPIDVIYSLHGQLLFSGNEDRASFERALKAEPLRRNDRAIPRAAHFSAGLLYSEVVRYSEHIERFVAALGRGMIRSEEGSGGRKRDSTGNYRWSPSQ